MNNIAHIIKEQATTLGFNACGFAKISPLEKDIQHLKYWLEKGYAGNMGYMNNYIDKRSNPSLLIDGAKSIIVFLLNYFPEKFQDKDKPQIASYAYGKDYHYIIKTKLNTIAETIKKLNPNSNNIICCDTAPVLERAWAVRAGLGWIGKSGMLINPEFGSFTFIGCIITTEDISLENTEIIESKCGNCKLCINACPTKAILDNKTIDARRCISYNTIENRDTLDPELEKLFGNRLYGCDECIKACPWNKKAKPHNIQDLKPLDGLLDLDWNTFSRSTHKNLLRNSAMQRASYKKLRERLQTILYN